MKQIKRILLAGLAVVSAGLATEAQTLTQDWKSTTDIPAQANARWGAGWDGKVYTNDKSVPTIYSWDNSEARSTVAAGAAGVGICTDDAGNLIMVNGWAGAGSMTSLKIWNKSTGTVSTVPVTVPTGATAARMDITGRAVGDVTSATGGAVFFCGTGNTAVAKIFIANSAQVTEKSKAIATTITLDNTTIAQPLTGNPESDEIAVRLRGNRDFYYNAGGTWKAYTRVGTISTSSGGDVVTLNGTLYTVEPSGTAYLDGFQIVDRKTNTVVATHDAEATTTNVNSYGTALNIQKIDEYTARIYQYHPGSFVAQYTFTLPGKPVDPDPDPVMPKLDAMNAYAYDINVAEEGDNYVVTYRLNAPAESAKVQLWANGKAVKEFEGTTLAEYGDVDKTTLNNLNTVTVPKSEMITGARVSFRVAVKSAALAAPRAASKAYKFYHPAGVAIDNNTDSPYFGRLYVTEAMNAPATGYHSSNEADKRGVYVFDQLLNPVENANGTYAFKGGQTFQDMFSNGQRAYDSRKIRISEDGRVFLSGQNENGIALWEVNPDDLNAAFTPVIKGTVNAETYEINTADGKFMAAPNVSLDVKGKGKDLRLLMLSANNVGMNAYKPEGYRIDEYNLGRATEWNAEPRNIDALSRKYTVTHSNATAIYDNEGGIWYVSSRANLNPDQPTLVHVNAAGEEDLHWLENAAGGAGIAFNPDFTRLAIAKPAKTIVIYAVSKDAEGKPVLTEERRFDTTVGNNTNDIAWDCADNLYIVGNVDEWLKAFSLPRTDNESVVSAPSKYDVMIPNDEYPVELYAVGLEKDWYPAEGITLKRTGEEAVYTATVTVDDAAFSSFAITSVKSADWGVVNANRWGAQSNNALTPLCAETDIQKGENAFCIGHAGTFTLTVNLADNKLTVDGLPGTLYMIGNVNGWDTSNKDFALEAAGAGVFEIKNVAFEGADGSADSYFTFVANPDNKKDDNWSIANVNRFGPAEDGSEVVWGEEANVGIHQNSAFKVKRGVYNIRVDLNSNTVTISYPETLYMIGNSNEEGFVPDDTSMPLTRISDGVYQIVEAFVNDSGNGFGYFAFTSKPDADWSVCNAHRFGPMESDTELAFGEQKNIWMYNTSYKIEKEVFADITVDLTTGTIIIENRKTSGVEEETAGEAKAIGLDGEIRILGEAQSVSVYSVSGQAVALNSQEKAFSAAKGVYVVVIDGKASKVMVK